MRARAVGLFVLVTALGTFAQSPMDQALAKANNETPKAPAAVTDSNPAVPESAPSAVMNDPATRAQYLLAMQRFYEYRANGYAYRSRVFEWQLLSSRVIFVIVILLVIAGIYFAAVQFHVAMIAARRNLLLPPDAPAGANPLATQLEISAKGVVINSSVLGVIILGLSLAFFYLYLVYVYPIENVF